MFGPRSFEHGGLFKVREGPLDIHVADGGSDEGGRLGLFSNPTFSLPTLCLLLIDEALVKEVIRFSAKGDVNFRLQFV